MRVSEKDIRGYVVNGSDFCPTCFAKMGVPLTSDMVITADDVKESDETWFCDEQYCQKEL